MQIAVLEDDPSQSELISYWLKGAGYQPAMFEYGQTFLKTAERESFDAILMDWNVPDADGLEVLRRVRENDWLVPVLFCTVRAEEQDVVKALRGGADDYLVKPLRKLELLERLASALRRGRKLEGADAVTRIEEFQIDDRNKTIARYDELLDLTAKDFEIAVTFLRNIGKLHTRRYIFETLWDTRVARGSRTLDTHVSRIRTKLQLTAANGWSLKGVYRYGYRLERIGPEED